MTNGSGLLSAWKTPGWSGLCFWLGFVGVGAAFVSTLRAHWIVVDDAFITFRYASNWVDGHGIVYNPGERVEGYTSFSYTALAALALLLGGDPLVWARVVGVGCACITLLLTWSLGYRLIMADDRVRLGPLVLTLGSWVAPCLLALNRSFAAWSVAGLETQLFSLSVLLTLERFCAERSQAATHRVRIASGSALACACAILTRPEGVLLLSGICCVLALDVLRGRRGWQFALRWPTLPTMVLSAHLTFRWLYYGDLLPNTYYAKVSGIWFEQGLLYLRYFAEQHSLYLVVPFVLVGAWRQRTSETRMAAVMLLVSVLYVLYTGGDRFEFRFLVASLPYLALLAQAGLFTMLGELRGQARMGFSVAPALAGFGLIAYAFWRPATLYHRTRDGIEHLEAIDRYAKRRSAAGRRLKQLVQRGLLRADERIAVSGAGALPYFSGLPTFDVLGITDRAIGHKPIQKRGIIAHEKTATWQEIKQRGVVIFDVRNRLFSPVSAGLPPPHFSYGSVYSGPVRCLRIDDQYLVFATPLSAVALRQRFPSFQLVF